MAHLHLSVLIVLFLLNGCSTNKMFVRSSSGLLSEASLEVETEKNWLVFREALPASIKLLESFHYVDPNNKTLLAGLVKAYTAFAFGVSETLYLEHQLKDEDSEHKKQAVFHYTRALNYGLRYFELNDLHFDELIKLSDAEALSKVLQKKIGDDEKSLEVIFFTANAWGGLINLSRTNITLMSQLSTVKSMFDFVCARKPEINFGACQMFYGAYEAGRPVALGGNPKKAKEHFDNLISTYPQSILARVAYMQFYAIPQQDQELFKKLSEETQKLEKDFLQSMDFGTSASYNGINKNSRMNIYQAIAIKRFNIMKELSEKLF